MLQSRVGVGVPALPRPRTVPVGAAGAAALVGVAAAAVALWLRRLRAQRGGDDPFAGRLVVLTGASEGIGAALATALAARGARLVLAARSADRLAAVAERCRACGATGVLAVPTDVADPAACRALAAAAAEFAAAAAGARAGVDYLVLCHGVSMYVRFEDVTDLSIFETIMRVNYLGCVHLTHALLPHVRAARGLLVPVSSLVGLTGAPTRSGYAASKHAVQGFFDSLRIELAGSGVDVLVVSPGFVRTAIRARAFGYDGRPLGQSPREEDSHETMPVEECVRLILRSMERRERALVMTRLARFGLWVRLVAPGFVDAIVAAKLRQKAPSARTDTDAGSK